MDVFCVRLGCDTLRGFRVGPTSFNSVLHFSVWIFFSFLFWHLRACETSRTRGQKCAPAVEGLNHNHRTIWNPRSEWFNVECLEEI